MEQEENAWYACHTSDTSNVIKNEVSKKNSTMLSKIKKVFKKESPEFTAEYAWIETTYGQGSYHTTEDRIRTKQESIIRTIKSKFPVSSEGYRFSNANGSYRCVIDIEEDLTGYVDEIFKPFIDGGFLVINLSKQVEEIEDEHVYLISWKNIFKLTSDEKKHEEKNDN